MHLLLTDRLVCPACGEDFGLILLANEVRDQRVLDGDLGCPGCRQKYPVRRGFADLRGGSSGDVQKPEPPPARSRDDSQEALRLGALLGVTEGPGTLLLQGPAAEHARSLSNLLEGVEVVALDPGQREVEETEGVSRLAAGSVLPFHPGSFRAALLSGQTTESDFREAYRVVAAPGRVVVLEAPPETRRWAESLRMEVLLEEEGVVVARARRSGSLPLVTLRGV
jgi:uncharacterized protein YbaR (Trm112 family)